MEETNGKDVDCVVWYYEEGKSKNEYTKKETVSLSLPVGIKNLLALKGLVR